MEKKLNPEKTPNRQLLIDATLDCVAELGLLGTTVSEIISRAGLSRGMIHLHFDGKSNLIVEAARFANQQYFDVLEQHIEASGATPSQLIQTVIRSDLCPECLNKRTASIWYELRGAARSNSAIAKFSDTRDGRLRETLKSATLQLCQKDRFPKPEEAARDATTGIIAFLEGMWTDFLLHPNEFDRAAAERVIFRFLMGIWPKAFDLSGARQ